MFARDIYRSFYFTAWNKLYNAEFLRKNKIAFNPNYTFAYDVLFNTEMFLARDCTGVYNHRPLYHFHQRHDSITHMPSVQMKRDDLRVFERIVVLLENKNMGDIADDVKRIHAFHSARYAETSASDPKLFAEFQSKAKLFADVYIEKNKRNTAVIAWFSQFLNC
jgi:hypothetical protein